MRLPPEPNDENLNDADEWGDEDEWDDEPASTVAGWVALPPDAVTRGGNPSVTQRRLEIIRRRRELQHRNMLVGAGLTLLLLIVLVRWRSPQEPLLVVAWPSKALGSSTLTNGATILMRGGQPFAVSIQPKAGWDVRWRWSGGSGEGLPIRWTPAGNMDTLELRCRAKPQGMQVLWSWLWPTRVLTLNGTSPEPLGGKRYVVVPQPGVPVRVSSRVVASHEAGAEIGATEARWHEDALPLLELAARKAPHVAEGATWTLVPSPDGKTPARDDATYVALSPSAFDNPEVALTNVARLIDREKPIVDIKWVARMQPPQDVPKAILWLDFERGRRRVGARGGWVVRGTNTLAEPVKWWPERD